MEYIFTEIDTLNCGRERKLHLALAFFCVADAVLGGLVWCAVSQWCLQSADWLVCFMGYPACIAWFVVYVYACRRGFHDGRYVDA